MENVKAVLTGDLIGSTKTSLINLDLSMAALKSAIAPLAAYYRFDPRFTRYRGDGWQVYLEHPGLVLRTSIMMIANLRADGPGLATRISAGLGTVSHLGNQGLSEAAGTAFIYSGQGLDKMPAAKRLVIAGDSAAIRWHQAVFDLIEWQSGRWSREQAEAVMLALDPRNDTQKDLAKTLNITRQALQARLSSAGYPALTKALWAFETVTYKEQADA